MSQKRKKPKLAGLPTPLKIMITLVYAGKPLTLTDLSDHVGIDRQLIKYHIPKLIKNGLLLKVQDNGTTYYSPQQVFIDKKLQDQLSSAFTPVMEIIAKNLIITEDIDPEEALKNNIVLEISVIESLLAIENSQ